MCGALNSMRFSPTSGWVSAELRFATLHCWSFSSECGLLSSLRSLQTFRPIALESYIKNLHSWRCAWNCVIVSRLCGLVRVGRIWFGSRLSLAKWFRIWFKRVYLNEENDLLEFGQVLADCSMFAIIDDHQHCLCFQFWGDSLEKLVFAKLVA